MNQPAPNTAVRSARALLRHPVATGLVLTSVVAACLLLRPHHDPTGAHPPKFPPLAITALEPRTAPPPNPEKTMSSSVSSALGFTGKQTLESRVHELMEMNSPLTAIEIDEAFRALLALPVQGESIPLHSTWFHELANLLQRQKPDQRAFSEVLATVANNRAQDIATRDYAIQHLNRVWSKADGDLELRHSIESTLGEIASSRSPLRPTALLNLHLLDPTGRGGVDATTLIDGVTAILADSKATGDDALHSRMVAARIAGERRLDSSRGPLLALATSESEHALVRMAAISALGKLADPSDMKALAGLSPKDSRVSDAIQYATALAGGK